MRKTVRDTSRLPSVEALRADTIAAADELLEAAAQFRSELKAFETTLRKARDYFGRGGSAASLHDVLDIVTARESLTLAPSTSRPRVTPRAWRSSGCSRPKA